MNSRFVALLAGLLALPCLGAPFMPAVDGAAKRVLERYMDTHPPGTATNLSAFGGQFTLNPVANIGFVCNDNFTVQGTIFGNLAGNASYADTAGSANSYPESDPVALSMGYQNADGVQAQIGLAMLSAGQISNPEWWGFLTSESDPVAMSQGFLTGAPWQSEGYLTSLSGRGTSELNNDSGFLAVSGDQFGLGSGFNIYGYAYGTEGRIPDYEQDRVAMSQGFLVSESDPVAMAAGFISGGDVPNYESDPVAMSQGFISFGGGTEGDLVVVSGGGLGTADPGTTIAAFASAQGFLTIETDPVAMGQGFVTASFPGAQDGDLVVVAGGCSSLSSMEPTTWLASHENDPIAMSQGFLTGVPWDSSVAYASEAGYAGSANTAYSADECNSWGGWTHVAIQGNGGQPTVGDMIFMSDAGLTMLSQYNISTPNPPVFLGSEWHDGVGNMPKWVLQSDMQAGYAAVSGSTSNVVSGVSQTFSLTNSFAGLTQVVVFADGIVTNRFKLP
jgi:hypothetical protein